MCSTKSHETTDNNCRSDDVGEVVKVAPRAI